MSFKLFPMETICITCQILFSGEKGNNITYLSSVNLAKRVVKLKSHGTMTSMLLKNKSPEPWAASGTGAGNSGSATIAYVKHTFFAS